MRRVCAAFLLALACLAVSPMSAASAGGPAAACKGGGGYANYVDPATGEAFTSQGKCVRFVAKGGTLEPVVEFPVTIAGVTTTGNLGYIGDPEGHSLCGGTRLSLYGYGTHTVVLSAEGNNSYFPGFTNTYTDVFFADGFWSAPLGNTVNGEPITVTVDGQEIGTVSPDCGSEIPAHLPAPDVTLSIVDPGNGADWVQVAGPAVPLGWYEVVFVVDGVPSDPTRIQVGYGGLFGISYAGAFPGQTVEVLIDGVSVGSIIA